MANILETAAQQTRDYINGWAALTTLMHEGKSWSGHERNCSYLNRGDGTFIDVSAVGGLDFLDDGRSLAVCDWDGDGALDVWLKSRTGPQLRFLRNNRTTDSHYVAFKLTGKSCNRDAVGARVLVEAGGRAMVRTVMAGDGYLAQSSKWLHFGLGDADSINRVKIIWPDGKKQELKSLTANRHYRVVQGDEAIALSTRRSLKFVGDFSKAPDTDGSARIILRTPLPLPPSVRKAAAHSKPKTVKLLNLWAHWCSPCREELTAFAQRQKEFSKAGIEIISLNLDKPEDREKARTWFHDLTGSQTESQSLNLQFPGDGLLDSLDAIFLHVRDKKGSWPLPTSFLIDPDGYLQIVYLGPVRTDQLIQDARSYGRKTVPPYLRGQYPGRWYFQIFRNLTGLASSLAEKGQMEDAAFYERLSRPRAMRP